MAKSDKPLAEIDLSRVFQPPHTPKWGKDKSINAFDFETHEGQPFLLSAAYEKNGPVLYPENGPRKLTGEEIFSVLTNRNNRNALNVWFNLDFDADVAVSTILDKEELTHLMLSGNVETDTHKITYIPSKFLKISDDNGHSYTHYDIAQFFYASLDNAVDEWLDTKKFTELVETPLFGSLNPERVIEVIEASENTQWADVPISKGDKWTKAHAWDYITKHYTKIRKYAQQDAIITRKLWDKAVSVGESLDVPMGKPFSTGYLAESYLNNYLGQKPGMGPNEMRKLAWKAYSGGRFEIIKRGYIGEVSGPDINSAYPFVLSHLPDPKTLTWKSPRNPTINDITNADYGFVRATVSTDTTRPIQPFAIKMKGNDKTEKGGKLKYPSLQQQELTTIKPIFELAYNEGYLTNYDIHEVWLGYENLSTKYPFTFVNDLYKERKQYEANGQYKTALWLKIVLNSMYGKTCQTTPKREKIEDKTVTLEDYQTFVSDLQLPPEIRDTFETGIIETLEAGSWFNPFLASYITGMTRLELHKRILEYNLEYDTVMLATDSLMIEQEPFEKSNFADDLVKKGLGNWDYDYQGKAIVIGAGIYQINFDTCQNKDCKHYDTTKCPHDTHHYKVKTRGFFERDLKGSLQDTMKQNLTEITVRNNRPITAKEAIWHNQPLSDIATFQDFEKTITPDMDNKRVWQFSPTFKDLLTQKESSKPLLL